jgi:four helix bundle protein
LWDKLDASISALSSNIAEGFERNTDKEFIYFYMQSLRWRSSFTNISSFDLEYISKQEFEELLESVTEISNYGFINIWVQNHSSKVKFKA